MVGAAGVRVALGEEQGPAVGWRVLGQDLDLRAAARVEGEVVQAGSEPVVFGGCQRG